MRYHRELLDPSGCKMALSPSMEALCEASYRMFQNGKDTEFIAQRYGIAEAIALKRVNIGRSIFINERSPYLAHSMQKRTAA